MSNELVTVDKALLVLLVQAAYEEGYQEGYANLDGYYQHSTTKEQLNKLLKGE